MILEVNAWQNEALEGMHDIYYGTALPPNRVPIPLMRPDDRIGESYFHFDPDKIVAIVETHAPDRNLPFSPPDASPPPLPGISWSFSVTKWRKSDCPRRCCRCNRASATFPTRCSASCRRPVRESHRLYRGDPGRDAETDRGREDPLCLRDCILTEPQRGRRAQRRYAKFRRKIILRPQEISNHPELIGRLGCIAMNGLIEADIYGNVNSTHVMGSRIQNGIGGSGDFARNAYVSIFRRRPPPRAARFPRSCRRQATSITSPRTFKCW